MIRIDGLFRRPRKRIYRPSGSAIRQTASARPQAPVKETEQPETEAALSDEPVALPESPAETDELEHISENIGMDVSDMIDMGKEDILIRQIDEFREKAKQLQQLMQLKEARAKELEGVVKEQTAKADSLERMVHARRTEADKIMEQVSDRFEEMSEGVRTEMTGLSDTVSKEVTGLTQNLTQELNRSSAETRQAFESAAQNMIDQNTRSFEGLREQLDALNHSEQIGELSNEMSESMNTLKVDLVEKIHAEDVKCYRNIQASLDEQSKVLSGDNEKLREQFEGQLADLQEKVSHHATISKVSMVLSILNLLGVAGIIALLFII